MNDMTQSTGVIQVASSGVPLWQFLLILLIPGIFAVSSVIIITRMIQAMYVEEHKRKMKIREAFIWTFVLGMMFGPLMQWGLQVTVHFLTGMPMDYRLLVVSVFVTGPFAMIVHPLLRVACVWRYNSTKKRTYKNIYDWLSVTTVKTSEGLILKEDTLYKAFDKTVPNYREDNIND